MKDLAPGQEGYAFALPRLAARLAGRKVRRAELCRWEAYGMGILVFGIACVFAGRVLLPFVRHGPGQLLALLLLPFAMWIVFLVVYFINARLAALLRWFGLYSARTNNSLQHFVIILVITFLSFLLVRDGNEWVRSLGVFWLGLVSLNLLSLLVLRLLHED